MIKKSEPKLLCGAVQEDGGEREGVRASGGKEGSY